MLEWLALIGFVLACAAITISLKTDRWPIRILCIVYIVACIVTQIVCHVNGWQSYFESEPKPSKDDIAYTEGYEIGLDRGYDVGVEDGYYDGYGDGESRGYENGYENGYYQCLEDYGIDDGVDVYIEGYLPKPDNQSETQIYSAKVRH